MQCLTSCLRRLILFFCPVVYLAVVQVALDLTWHLSKSLESSKEQASNKEITNEVSQLFNQENAKGIVIEWQVIR